MELVFVTANQHKAAEVAAMIGYTVELKMLNDLGITEDIPETGDTFEANASQKSHYVFDRFGLDCFADDSGLEVDALNGEPGVYSAHYSGSRDAATNLNLVLQNMQGIPNRKARFISVISLIINGEEHFFKGVVEGQLTRQPSGGAGFGYDPIFIPDGYTITFAEMDAAEKNRISHRGRAVKKMAEFIEEFKNLR